MDTAELEDGDTRLDGDDPRIDLEALRRRLCAQSTLFERPTNYEAGVLDALQAVGRLLPEHPPDDERGT